jgi:asparaginyl-tRNA synthetase
VRYFIADLKDHVGKTVELKGWVHHHRSSGKIKFLVLRDGTGFCQCVFVKGEAAESVFADFEKLTQETTVKVTGVVRADPRNPNVFEITGMGLEIYSITQDYPISPKEHGPDFLMSNRHLWIRSKTQHAVLRVRAEIISAIRSFFDGRGFTLTDSPIFTPSACEGTSTLFQTKYFDEQAYLSQSGQLYLEATAAAFGKSYCFGPTFRAEKSKTRKHLIEFWMLEAEVAFNELSDNMELIEQFVEYVVQRTIVNKAAELKVLERDTSKLALVKGPFPRVHYDEAAAMIKKERPEFIVGDDFGAPDEAIVSGKFETPVFVHRFPAAVKAFYMKQDPAAADKTMSCDLLAPEGYGEIVGGGQREESLQVLLDKIKEHGLKEEDFAWYLDLRKYGAFPHSGFGLGLERTVSWICGLQHIREAIPFPRLYGRIYP